MGIGSNADRYWLIELIALMAGQSLVDQGLLIVEALLSHSDIYTTVDRKPLDEGSDRRRPLPDNTQHSQHTDDHAPGGTGARNPARERPQTHTVDGAATGTGSQDLCSK